MLLEKGGYTYLDVRPTMRLEEVGRVRRAVNVPFVQVSWLAVFLGWAACWAGNEAMARQDGRSTRPLCR